MNWWRALAIGITWYLVLGVIWTSIVSLQRAILGWDLVNEVFVVRAVLRALVWPFDVGIVTRVPVGMVLLAYAGVVLATVWRSARRPQMP